MKKTLISRLTRSLYNNIAVLLHGFGKIATKSADILHRNGKVAKEVAGSFYRRSGTRPIDLPTFGDEYDYTSDDQREIEEWHMRQKACYILKHVFELMEDYELDYFVEHCLEESKLNMNMVWDAARLAVVVKYGREDMDLEIELNSCTSKLFAFMFNKFSQYVWKGDYEFEQVLDIEPYFKSDLEPIYQYEIKRRFAESLDKELIKHDRPTPKRVKI